MKKYALAVLRTLIKTKKCDLSILLPLFTLIIRQLKYEEVYFSCLTYIDVFVC